ncbi:MAG: LysR family transcriptional regulator [Stenotrophomonas maltophilia]
MINLCPGPTNGPSRMKRHSRPAGARDKRGLPARIVCRIQTISPRGMQMDRFDAMQAFARVVETGSFTKAADTLHMSRTTVTQLVQHLEARLRVRLLNRTTRQVNVTADGAAYYARVIRLLADIDDAETSLSTAAAAPRGRLRVDVPAPFARLVLVPALPDFLVRYPEIQLDLGVSDRHVDLIDENVDCVIRGGQITDQSLVARHIGDLQAGIHASPAYLQHPRLARLPAAGGHPRASAGPGAGPASRGRLPALAQWHGAALHPPARRRTGHGEGAPPARGR